MNSDYAHIHEKNLCLHMTILYMILIIVDINFVLNFKFQFNIIIHIYKSYVCIIDIFYYKITITICRINKDYITDISLKEGKM